MINLSLDRHDFVAAVEGFARSSHLRQHVWHRIVFSSIPQMTDDEMDFFYFVFRRNLWDCYFREADGRIIKHCGNDEYLHALAVLHRGNRYQVTFCNDRLNQPITAMCYRFGGEYRPLSSTEPEFCMVSFNSFIPAAWIEKVHQEPMPVNKYVNIGKEQWWTDMSVFDDMTLINYETI